MTVRHHDQATQGPAQQALTCLDHQRRQVAAHRPRGVGQSAGQVSLHEGAAAGSPEQDQFGWVGQLDQEGIHGAGHGPGRLPPSGRIVPILQGHASGIFHDHGQDRRLTDRQEAHQDGAGQGQQDENTGECAESDEEPAGTGGRRRDGLLVAAPRPEEATRGYQEQHGPGPGRNQPLYLHYCSLDPG